MFFTGVKIMRSCLESLHVAYSIARYISCREELECLEIL